MSDDTIYRDPGILVTSSIVTIKDDTYSVRNINSVNITKESISGYVSTMFAIVVGFFVMEWMYDTIHGSETFFNICTVFMVIIFIKSLYSAIRPNYYLVFSISNGRTKALTAKSRNVLAPVKNAIEIAFSRR